MKNILIALLIIIFNFAVFAQGLSEQERFKLAAQYSRETRGLSVLVMKGDKIIFEDYQNGHSAESAHYLASGTKSFSGVMLAAAIEDKLIRDFDEKVADTITEWKADEKKSKITLRHLLSLTSGLDAGQIGIVPGYKDAIDASVKYDAGAAFEYGPAPFQIFGELMRRKLALKNEGVMDYLKRRILDPIGLKIAFWRMKDGNPLLPQGASLTAREWAKFGLFLKNGGKWNGKQLIAKKLLDELIKGSKANPAYGITFWLNRKSGAEKASAARRADVDEISRNGISEDIAKDLFMAAGAGKQRLYVIPSLDLVIVRQGNQGRFDDEIFLKKLILGK